MEAIFLAIIPLLPTPVTTIFPLVFFKIFTAFAKFLSNFFDKVSRPLISVFITFFAVLIICSVIFFLFIIIYLCSKISLSCHPNKSNSARVERNSKQDLARCSFPSRTIILSSLFFISCK